MEYNVLERENLDSEPKTIRQFRQWLADAFSAVKRWLEHDAGIDEADFHFCAAVVNRATMLARRFGAGELAQSGVSHKAAFELLGRLHVWSEQQKTQGAMTPETVAKELHVSRDKVIGWIKSGELRAVNVAKKSSGRPRYRIDPAELKTLQDRRTATTQRKQKRTRTIRPSDVIEFY